MNKNINLTKILKDCPKDWKLYSPLGGEVEFKQMEPLSPYPIIVTTCGTEICFTKEGFYFFGRNDAECLIFPSKKQRDWSKFEAPWRKKDKEDKFDPRTLKPFDKVLIWHCASECWSCEIFSHLTGKYTCNCIYGCYTRCMPYNDDTKHLAGTTDEAPEYYKYWED